VPILISLLVVAAVALLAYIVLSTFFSEERQVARRLSRMTDWESRQAREVEPLLQPFGQRVLQPAAESLRRVTRRVAPADYRAELRRRLQKAGNPRGIDAERFLAIKVVGTLAVILLFVAVSFIVTVTRATWLLVAIPLVVLAWYGPNLWLRSAIDGRMRTIQRSLPDMLDMLTISVEAGLGFDGAIAKLVRNTPGPLSEEFARMLQEVQAGVDRSTALRNMSARVDVPELNAFIMAIVQAEVFGISVATVLRTQASEMRLKRRQRAEELAQKAPVKIVFPLVICILPATLIVILGPAVVSIGRALLGM